MKRSVMVAAVALVFSVAPGAALAAPPQGAGDHVPEVAIAKCDDVIGRQSDKGIEAGGGPKGGILAPTNCDWFWFAIGAIGGSD